MQEAQEESISLTQLGILLKKRYDENNKPIENRINIDEYINKDQEVAVNEVCNSENWEEELFQNYVAAQNVDSNDLGHVSDDKEEVVQENE